MIARRQTISASAGDVLFSPGQECSGFILLRSGSIRVTMTARNGREVVLYRVKPGDVCLQTFSCLVEGQTYSAEGVAETDLTGEFWPSIAFHDALAGDAAFRGAVLGAIAHRFADYQQLVEDVALTGFDARLARGLLRLADADDTIAISHDELAVETASGRAAISRRLADFAGRGLIAMARRRIQILDRAGLKNIAADED